jgi:hypothetical protein
MNEMGWLQVAFMTPIYVIVVQSDAGFFDPAALDFRMTSNLGALCLAKQVVRGGAE